MKKYLRKAYCEIYLRKIHEKLYTNMNKLEHSLNHINQGSLVIWVLFSTKSSSTKCSFCKRIMKTNLYSLSWLIIEYIIILNLISFSLVGRASGLIQKSTKVRLKYVRPVLRWAFDRFKMGLWLPIIVTRAEHRSVRLLKLLKLK